MLAIQIAKSLLTPATHCADGYCEWPEGASGTDIQEAKRFSLHAALEYGASMSGENLTDAFCLARDELPGTLSMREFNARASLKQIHALLDRAVVGAYA